MTPLFPWREAWTWDDGNPGKRPCILLMLNIFHDLPHVPTIFDEALDLDTHLNIPNFTKKKGDLQAAKKKKNEKRRFPKAGDFSYKK